jgi:hypothetical protein
VQEYTTIFDGQVMTGGLVLTIVTVWLQMLLSPQPSVYSHVSVMNCGHVPLVTMSELLVTLLQQLVRTVGVPKLQAVPQATVKFVGQFRSIHGLLEQAV